MAASCWRRMNSRWFFSRPSLTSVRIFSWSACSARASLTQPRTRRTRSVTSTVSSSSTLRSSDRSGHQPAASARASGSSRPRRTSARRRPPISSNSSRNPARSSDAELAGLIGDLGVHGLGLEPEDGAGAGDAGAQQGPLVGPDHQGRDARGQLAGGFDRGDRCRRRRGGRRGGGPAAAGRRRRWRRPQPWPRRTRGRWSSTMPGRTTPLGRGRTGSVSSSVSGWIASAMEGSWGLAGPRQPYRRSCYSHHQLW